jgi:PAS domain S-box-containing protein
MTQDVSSPFHEPTPGAPFPGYSAEPVVKITEKKRKPADLQKRGGPNGRHSGSVQNLAAIAPAEASLRSKQEPLLLLAETLPVLVWASDAEGVKTYCNRRYLEFTGISSLAEMNTRWQDCVHPDDRQPVTEAWIHALATGEPYTSSYRLRRHDGVYRQVLARALAVRDDDGQIDQWLGTTTDIHEQTLAEEMMRRTEKLATAARMAASIAHEINNPLASVTNALYLALQAPELSPKTRQYLKLADRELARVAQVTTQTLRFHKQAVAPVLASLRDLIDAALAVFAPRLESLGISVRRDYPAEHKLYCFADEMRQAFAHIVCNSLDAMAQGGRLQVRIRTSRRWDDSPAQGVRITIADSGTGIPAELRAHIFEAFVSTKDPTGTGLGLWVVDGIIRKHQGSISLKSSTDSARHGTVLMLFLPFASAIE